MNKWIISGHLGQDPRVHRFPDGSSVLTISVAVREPEKVDGKWVDKTLWVSTKLFAKAGSNRVDYLSQRLKKGSKVVCDGRCVPREYTDRDGVVRVAQEMRANDIEPMDKAESTGKGYREDDGGPGADAYGPRTQMFSPMGEERARKPQQRLPPLDDDDPLPF